MAILKPSVLTSSDKFSFLYKNLFWLNTKDTILSQTPPSTIFVGFFKYTRVDAPKKIQVHNSGIFKF